MGIYAQEFINMASEYKVTIAIPFYNVAEYIGTTLLSALNQTFASIEFLLVNDGSTDNSLQVVRDLKANHSRGKDVRIVEHPRNLGVAQARNTTFENATGEYFYFLDSDDTITPDCIEILYNKMMEHPVDFVVASYDEVDLDGKMLYQRVCREFLVEGEFEPARVWFGERVHKRDLYPLILCNKLYRSSFLNENNLRCMLGYILEDLKLSFMIMSKAYSCRTISDITYHYLQRPGSIMHSTKKKVSNVTQNGFFQMFYLEKELLESYKNEDFYGNAITSIMSDIYMHLSILYNRPSDTPIDKQKIKEVLRYPAPFRMIRTLKHKKMLNYIFYINGKMPSFVQDISFRLKYFVFVWKKRLKKTTN